MCRPERDAPATFSGLGLGSRAGRSLRGRTDNDRKGPLPNFMSIYLSLFSSRPRPQIRVAGLIYLGDILSDFRSLRDRDPDPLMVLAHPFSLPSQLSHPWMATAAEAGSRLTRPGPPEGLG